MRHALTAAILAIALAAAPALAVGPEAQPDQPATSATAGMAQKLNPIAVVESMNKSIRANEEQTQAAVAAMQSASKPAQSAPAAKAGGGKIIYGDIIIHK